MAQFVNLHVFCSALPGRVTDGGLVAKEIVKETTAPNLKQPQPGPGDSERSLGSALPDPLFRDDAGSHQVNKNLSPQPCS